MKEKNKKLWGIAISFFVALVAVWLVMKFLWK